MTKTTMQSGGLVAQNEKQEAVAKKTEKPNVNGEAYLIPFKNNKKGGVYECQFIVGYKGLMLLARRSGEVANIDALTVYENDEFDLSYGFDPALIHKP